MHKSTKWTGIGVAGALTAAALIVPGLATAQTDEATDDAADDAVESEHGTRHEAFVDALAEELGITPEELQEALENVQADFREERLAALRARLDEQVANGEMSQELADELYERAEDGDWPFGRGRRHGPRGLFGPFGDGGTADDADAEATTTAA
jgi:flagellar motility protein MotE (MotC chaperone)